jgi:hypothetical protein
MDDRVFIDYWRRTIRLTAERQHHILSIHPEMAEWISKIGDVLTQPEWVVQSRSDLEVELFYVWQTQTRVVEKFLCVVVVVKENDAFVLTSYFTDTIKKGQILWPKNNT